MKRFDGLTPRERGMMRDICGAAPDEPTISERLRAAGYGHRHNERTPTTQAHTVYRLETGESVADMTAHQAVTFLETDATEAGAQLVIPGAERRNVSKKPQRGTDDLPLFKEG